MEAELEKNPLLKREDGVAEPLNEGDGPEIAAAERDLDAMTDSVAAADMDARPDDVSPGERATGDGPEESASGATDWSKASKGGTFEDIDGLDGARAKEKTLTEHLHDQLAVAGLNSASRAVACVLIDGIDEGGYMRIDLSELPERLGCSEALIESALAALQGFEPVGVFARDGR